MGQYICGLIKIFSEKEYAQQFIDGKLYMNNIDFFIKSQLEEVGDSQEVTSLALRKGLEINGVNHIYGVNIIDESSKYHPAFCMTTIYSSDISNDNSFMIDERLLKFGEYAVVVTNVKEFLSRVQIKEPLFDYSIVKYVDFNNICGSGAIFNPIVKKSNEYKHQKEFRIYSDLVFATKNKYKEYGDVGVVKCIKADYYESQIGNINDITSEIIPTQKLIDGYSINFNINWEFCKKNKLDFTTQKLWVANDGERKWKERYETSI